jgi:uncharacterized protein YjbJ (UPF0337 family)
MRVALFSDWERFRAMAVVTPQRSRERKMGGGTADKVKGGTNKVVGRARQGLGTALGNTRIQVKGAMQEAKGKTQIAVGRAKRALRKSIDGRSSPKVK